MYTILALLLLAIALGTVTKVVDSVLDTVGLGETLRAIPVVGPNLNLGIAILMIWVLDLRLVERYTGEMRSTWLHIVADGVLVFALIPVKDAVVGAIAKGVRA